MCSERVFRSKRVDHALTKIFTTWKEETLHSKLARLFFLRKVLGNWSNYVYMRNHILPREFRERRLQKVFLDCLQTSVRETWKGKRSIIIARQLATKRKEKLLKVVFLRFLENLLKAK
jgi:hypothetical protein